MTLAAGGTTGAQKYRQDARARLLRRLCRDLGIIRWVLQTLSMAFHHAGIGSTSEPGLGSWHMRPGAEVSQLSGVLRPVNFQKLARAARNERCDVDLVEHVLELQGGVVWEVS